jgi:hypothetical protein
MVKNKTKKKGGTRVPKKRSTKSSNRKKPVSKKKPVRAKRNSKSSSRKKKITRHKRPNRKTRTTKSTKKRVSKKVSRPLRITRRNNNHKKKTTVRLASDTKFWQHRRTRLLRGEAPRTRAAYSTKSLSNGRPSPYFPTVGTTFNIRKKFKQLDAASVDDEAVYSKIERESARYLKLTKKKRSKAKGVYMKIAYQDEEGRFAFASISRQDMDKRQDITSAIDGIRVSLRNYGQINVVGYEVEEVI